MTKRKTESLSAYRARARAAAKAYVNRPEVWERRHRPEEIDRRRRLQRDKYQEPEEKERRQIYSNRPDVKKRTKMRLQSPKYQAKRHTPAYKEKLQVYGQTYLGTPERLLRGAVLRARQRGTACSITMEDVLNLIPADNCCPYCKNEMLPKTRHARSLDEVIPGRGYTLGNVDVVCRRCNTQKADSPAWLLELFAARMRQVESGG